MSQSISRRVFLKVSATAGAGLLASISLIQSCTKDSVTSPTASPQVKPGLWVRIDSDNTVSVIIPKSEMGQGIVTSLAMLVVEELGADWSKVRTEWAPADLAYGHYMHNGMQSTGASTSIRDLWKPLRQAGAALRETLIESAAKVWAVSRNECRSEKSFIVHGPSGKRLSYGELTNVAAKLPIPQDVTLKKVEEFQIIGRPIPGLDAKSKITGAATFGFDVQVPGMLVAVVSRCPVFGGIPVWFDASESLAVKGVRHVIKISQGVAVVADNFWAAKLGRDALKVTWDPGPNKNLDSATIGQMLKSMIDSEGVMVYEHGDNFRSSKDADRRVESVYSLPYLAHAPMEPLSCTTLLSKNSCEVWGPTQNLTRAQRVAALITGLPHSSIRIHSTFLGCSFGRASFSDHIAESVEIAKKINKPVKTVWTREDDIQHDQYHPATMHWLSSDLDEKGWPETWFHRIAGISDFMDDFLVAGADEFPYAIENAHVECVQKTRGKLRNLPRYVRNLIEGRQTYNGMWNSKRTSIPFVPTGNMRSVAHYHNAFVIQSFIDELAAKAEMDPYLYQRHLLRNSPRDRAVLDLAASKFEWGKPLEKGRYAGIAQHKTAGSCVAQVAEISISDKGGVRVHRVVCAIDCGIVVNPDTVKAQVEGGIVFGLTSALKGKITISEGSADQSNFHDYPLLAMSEMPYIEVHIMPNRESPTGVGEIAVPPIAPAVANAVFFGTGKRIRRLPIDVRTEKSGQST